MEKRGDGEGEGERAGQSAGERRVAVEPAGPCPHLPRGFGLKDPAPARILAAARYSCVCFSVEATCVNPSCQLRVGELRLLAGQGAGALILTGEVLQFPQFSGWQRQPLPYLLKERGQILLLPVSSECATPCPHLLCEACCQGEGSLADTPAEESMPHTASCRAFFEHFTWAVSAFR